MDLIKSPTWKGKCLTIKINSPSQFHTNSKNCFGTSSINLCIWLCQERGTKSKDNFGPSVRPFETELPLLNSKSISVYWRNHRGEETKAIFHSPVRGLAPLFRNKNIDSFTQPFGTMYVSYGAWPLTNMNEFISQRKHLPPLTNIKSPLDLRYKAKMLFKKLHSTRNSLSGVHSYILTCWKVTTKLTFFVARRCF